MEYDIDEIKRMGEHLMGEKPKEKSTKLLDVPTFGGKDNKSSDSFEMPKFDMQKNDFFAVPEFGTEQKPKSSKPLMGGLASEEDTEKLAALGKRMLGL